MKLSLKLLSNSFYLFFDMIVVNLLGFVFWFIIGKFLLPEQTGIVSTTINFALIFSSITMLGFSAALYKLIPEYLEKKEKKKIVGLLRFSFRIVFVANIVTVFILFLLAPSIAPIIKVPVQTFLLALPILFFVSLTTLFGSAMTGFQDMSRFFKTDFLGTVLKVTITAVLLFFGFTYFGPLVGVLIGFIAISFLRFNKSWFFAPSEKVAPKLILLEYSFPSFISSLMSLLVSNFQIVLLAILQTQAITGVFSIAFLITSYITVFPNLLSQALFPIMSLLSVGSRSLKQVNLIRLIFRYALFLILPLSVLFVMFSKTILFLIRPEFLSASDFFPILTLGSIFSGLASIFIGNIYAIGKTKLNRNIWIFLSLTFLIIATILTILYSSKGLSVAYLTFSIMSFFAGYYFLRKHLKLDMKFGNSLKCIFAAALFLSMLFVSDVLKFNFFIKVIVALLGSFIYLAILVPLRFYQKEDIRIIEIVASRVPVFKSILLRIAKLLANYI